MILTRSIKGDLFLVVISRNGHESTNYSLAMLGPLSPADMSSHPGPSVLCTPRRRQPAQ